MNNATYYQRNKEVLLNNVKERYHNMSEEKKQK